MAKVGHPAFADIALPLVEQRPAGGAGAEVGHVLILRQAVDGFLKDARIAAEDGAVTGQQKLGVVAVDALERLDEVAAGSSRDGRR